MKIPHGLSPISQSCSCTSCVYKIASDRPSFRRMIRLGSRASRVQFCSNLPARERKLLDKLVTTRTEYDRVRNELLSSSGIDDERNKNKKSQGQDDINKPSAILDLVKLIDKGEALGLNELSECCSCCICSLMNADSKQHKGHRHHHVDHGRAVRADYSSQSSVLSRQKEGRPHGKAVRFKTKYVHSDPCTCTAKLSEAVKRRSKEMISKLLEHEKPQNMMTKTDETERTYRTGKTPVQKYNEPKKSVRNTMLCQCPLENSAVAEEGIAKHKHTVRTSHAKEDVNYNFELNREMKAELKKSAKKISKLAKESKVKLKESIEVLAHKSAIKIKELEAKRQLGRHICDCPEVSAEITKMAKQNLKRQQLSAEDKLAIETGIAAIEDSLEKPKVKLSEVKQSAQKLAGVLQKSKTNLNRKMQTEIRKSGQRITEIIQESRTKLKDNMERTVLESIHAIKKIDTKQKHKRNVCECPEEEKLLLQKRGNQPIEKRKTKTEVVNSSERLEQTIQPKQIIKQETQSHTSYEMSETDSNNKVFRIKKDSRDKYRDALVKKAECECDWECEPPCLPEKCIPQQCYENILLRQAKFAEMRNINQMEGKRLREKSLSDLNSRLDAAQKKLNENVGIKKTVRTKNRSVSLTKPFSQMSDISTKTRQARKSKKKDKKKNSCICGTTRDFKKKESKTRAGGTTRPTVSVKLGKKNKNKSSNDRVSQIISKMSMKKRKLPGKKQNRSTSTSSSSQSKSTLNVMASSPPAANKLAQLRFEKKRKPDMNMQVKKIKYQVTPEQSPQSSKNIVRIGSAFSFNIEFSKETREKQQQPVYKAPKHKISKSIIRKPKTKHRKVDHRGPRSSNRRSQSSSSGKSVSTGNKGLRRCFCTLKLGNRVQNDKNISETKKLSKGTLASGQFQARVLKSAGTKTKKQKMSSKYNLLPYECDPGYCVVGECDPYECLKAIKMRTSRRRSKASNTFSQRTRSDTTLTSRPTFLYRNKNVQSAIMVSKNEKIAVKPRVPQVISYPDRLSRQAVRIGSNFSFNIEFSRDKTTPTANAVTVPQQRLQTAKRVVNKNKGFLVGPALKRCFCTLKLLKANENKLKQQKIIGLPKLSSGSRSSQAKRTNSKDSAVTVKPILKRCFCTLQLQRHGKNQQSVVRFPSNNVRGQKIYTVSRMTVENGEVSLAHKNKQQIQISGSSLTAESVTGYALHKLKNKNCSPNTNETSVYLFPKTDSEVSATSLKSFWASSASYLISSNVIKQCSTQCPKIQKRKSLYTSYLKRCFSTTKFKTPISKVNDGNQKTDISKGTKNKLDEANQNTSQELRIKKSSRMCLKPKRSAFVFISQPLSNFHRAESKVSEVINISPFTELQTVYHQSLTGQSYPRLRKKLEPIRASHSSSSSFTQTRRKKKIQQYVAGPANQSRSLRQTYTLAYIHKDSDDTYCTPTSHTGAYLRQRARISSNFSFSLEFSRDTVRPNLNDENSGEITECECTVYEKKKRTRKSTPSKCVEQRPLPKMRTQSASTDRRKYLHSPSDRSNDAKSIMTTSFVKHCFCYTKLGKKKRQSISDIEKRTIKVGTSTKPGKKEKTKPQTKTTDTKTCAQTPRSKSILKKCMYALYQKTLGRSNCMKPTTYDLKPYECEPGVCIPGSCDPYECQERIKCRKLCNSVVNTEMPPKISKASCNSSRTFKAQKVQAGKMLRDSARSTTTEIGSENSQHSRPYGGRRRRRRRYSERQAVRIGSNFSFNFEFYKDRPLPLDRANVSSSTTCDCYKHVKNAPGRCFCTEKLNKKKRQSVILRPKQLDHINECRCPDIRTGTSSTTCDCYERNTSKTDLRRIKKPRPVMTAPDCCFYPVELNKKKRQSLPRPKEFKQISTCGIEKGTLKTADTKIGTQNGRTKTILKKCVCIMNQMTLSRSNSMEPIGFDLKPYECEPGICIPGSCDPYECQERIIRRKLNRDSMVNTEIPPKVSTASSNLSKTLRAQKVQAGRMLRDSAKSTTTEIGSERLQHRRPRGARRRRRGRHSDRQTVRIGSNFSFNLEFYKDRPLALDRTNEISSTTCDCYEHGSSKKDLKRVKKSFSSAKLNKKNTKKKHESFPTPKKMKHKSTSGVEKRTIKVGTGTKPVKKQNRKPRTKTIDTKTGPQNGRTEAILKKCACIMNQMTLGKSNNMKSTGIDLKLYECEPGVCIPGSCDPYECQERIERRKLKRDSVLNTEMPPKLSKASSNVSRTFRPQKIQAGRMLRDSANSTTTEIGSKSLQHRSAHGARRRRRGRHSDRQTVRIGSNFSFNLELYKDRPLALDHTNEISSTTCDCYEHDTPKKNLKRANKKHDAIPKPKKIKHKSTSGIERRTIKVGTGVKRVKKEKITPQTITTETKTGPQNGRTKIILKKCACIMNHMTLGRSNNAKTTAFDLNSYECEPEVCIPGSCDPYECQERINRRKLTRDSMVNTKMPPNISKASWNSSRTFKAQKTQAGKMLRESANNATAKIGSKKLQRSRSHGGRRRQRGRHSDRQAVKIDSNFSFKLEFYKGRPLALDHTNETSSTTCDCYKHSTSKIDLRRAKKTRPVKAVPGRCFCTAKLNKKKRQSIPRSKELKKKSTGAYEIRTVHVITGTKPDKNDKTNPQTKMTNTKSSLQSGRPKAILKKCVCVMHQMTLDRHNCIKPTTYDLKPYECEPGGCIPGSCDPYECQERIKCRKLNRDSMVKTKMPPKISKASLYSSRTSSPKKIQARRMLCDCATSATEMCSESVQHSRPHGGRRNRRRGRHSSREDMNTSAEKRIVEEVRSNRQAVRISSNFSFNVEFYKDRPLELDHSSTTCECYKHDTSKKDLKRSKKSRSVKTVPSRCFCTAKLNKKKGQSNQRPKELKRKTTSSTEKKTIKVGTSTKLGKKEKLKPSTKTTDKKSGPQNGKAKSIIKKCVCIMNQMTLGRRNSTKLTGLGLKPYECEPGVCIPGSCDPYECQERIKCRKLKCDSMVNTETPPKISKASSNSSKTKRKYKKIQAGRMLRDSANSTTTDIGSESIQHKRAHREHRKRRRRHSSRDDINNVMEKRIVEEVTSDRQAVRISSNFSFNVEFYKNRPLELNPSSTTCECYKHATSKKDLKRPKKSRSVKTVPSRCFCTAKLNKKKRQATSRPKELKQKTTSAIERKTIKVGTGTKFGKVEKPITQTKTTDTKVCPPNGRTKTILKKCFCIMHQTTLDRSNSRGPAGLNLKLHECEPGVCIPGYCDPYECQERIKRRKLKRDSMVNTEMPPKKSRTSSGSSKTVKTKKVQAGRVLHDSSNSVTAEIGSERLQRKRAHGKHRKRRGRHSSRDDINNFMEKQIVEEVRSDRQAVRISSNFSFNVEFYKDRPLASDHVNETEFSNVITDSINNQPRKRKARTTSEMDLRRAKKSRPVNTTPGRCFCTLSLINQKDKRKHSDQSYTKMVDAGTKTDKKRNKPQVRDIDHVKNKRIQNSLLRYACEPYVCVPGECNPYVCLERIKRNRANFKETGSITEYNQRSVGSTTLRDKKKHGKYQTSISRKQGNNYSNISKSRAKRPQGTRIPISAHPSLTDQSRQVVKIGSSFSFDVEFYKNNTLDQGDKLRKAEIPYESVSKERPHRSKNYQVQTDTASVRSTMTGMGPLLKRCFCTLKLQSEVPQKKGVSKKSASTKIHKNILPCSKICGTVCKNACTATNKKYMKPMLEPYECEPGICTPGECDPYECLKRNQRVMRSRGSGTNRETLRQRGSSTKRLSKSRGNQSQKRHQVRYRNTNAISKIHEKSRKDRTEIHEDTQIVESLNSNRQVVRIGSNFSFNLEFYKDIPTNHDVPEFSFQNRNGEISKYSKNVEHKKPKMKSVGNYDKSLCRDCECQSVGIQTKNKRTGTFLQRCLCILNLQKTKVSKRKNLKSSAVQSNLDYENKILLRSTGTKAMKNRKLLKEYECEPNTCVVGKCNPYECYERIQKRLKNSSTETPCKTCTSATQFRGKKYRTDKSTRAYYKPRDSKNGVIDVETKNEGKYDHVSGNSKPFPNQDDRQAVKISSNFSFDVEFFKNKPNSANNVNYDTIKNTTNLHGENEHTVGKTRYSGPKRRVSDRRTGGYRRDCRDSDSQIDFYKQSISSNTEKVVKRCFCTLKLQQKQLNTPAKTKIKYPNDSNVYNLETTTIGAANKMILSERQKAHHELDSYKYESVFSIPGPCNPYVCAEGIKKRNKHVTSTQIRRPITNDTSINNTAKRKGVLFNYEIPNFSLQQTNYNLVEVPHFTNVVGKKHLQSVRFGSDFNIGYSERNIVPHKQEVNHLRQNNNEICYSEGTSQFNTKKKSIAHHCLEVKPRQNADSDKQSNKCQNKQSQKTGAKNKIKATGIGKILKRYFCKFKLQNTAVQPLKPYKVNSVEKVTVEEDKINYYGRITKSQQVDSKGEITTIFPYVPNTNKPNKANNKTSNQRSYEDNCQICHIEQNVINSGACIKQNKYCRKPEKNMNGSNKIRIENNLLSCSQQNISVKNRSESNMMKFLNRCVSLFSRQKKIVPEYTQAFHKSEFLENNNKNLNASNIPTHDKNELHQNSLLNYSKSDIQNKKAIHVSTKKTKSLKVTNTSDQHTTRNTRKPEQQIHNYLRYQSGDAWLQGCDDSHFYNKNPEVIRRQQFRSRQRRIDTTKDIDKEISPYSKNYVVSYALKSKKDLGDANNQDSCNEGACCVSKKGRKYGSRIVSSTEKKLHKSEITNKNPTKMLKTANIYESRSVNCCDICCGSCSCDVTKLRIQKGAKTKTKLDKKKKLMVDKATNRKSTKIQEITVKNQNSPRGIFFGLGPFKDPNKPKKCPCGSAICGRELKKMRPPIWQGKKLKKPCICGSKVCAKKAKKDASPKKKKKKVRKFNRKKKTKKWNLGKRYKEYMKNRQARTSADLRAKRYKKLDSRRHKYYVKQIKQLNKLVNERKDDPNVYLLLDSLKDILRIGEAGVGSAARLTYRTIRDPKHTAKALLYQGLADTSSTNRLIVSSACERVGKRLRYTTYFKGLYAKFVNTKIGHAIVHINDKVKHRVPFVKKKSREIDVGCSLFVGSLRHKPHLWVYEMCPWFYPHCISLVTIWRQFLEIILFLLAVVVWSPCILCMEGCRGLMCCTFCTQ